MSVSGKTKRVFALFLLACILVAALLSGSLLFLEGTIPRPEANLPSLEHATSVAPRIDAASETTQEDAHPYLSEGQERALETVGIDPATLPQSVTPAQEACLIEAVGEARAAEIRGGSLPTIAEIVRAKACF